MIMDEQSFEAIKTDFLLSNSCKYTFDKLNSSIIINNLAITVNEESINDELNCETTLDSISALVYLYVIVFILYKKNKSNYHCVLIEMKKNNIIYANEMLDLFSKYGTSNSYLSINFSPKPIITGARI